MNKIIILGRLVKDPEVRYTTTGKPVASFSLAVNRPFKSQGEQETDFIPVVLWGKTAEIAGNYVHKGQRLLVEGRLQVRSYTAKDGSNRWVTEVVGDSIEFIEKKSDSSNNNDSDNGNNGDFGDMGLSQPFNESIPF